MGENSLLYEYDGKITEDFRLLALQAFKRYEADKSALVRRIKDNEMYYRDMYNKDTDALNKKMNCSTPLLFSSIENACATSSENYPSTNIIEREPDGGEVAKLLSTLVDTELDHIGFKKKYKSNTRNKLKYGTAIYGVFYDPATGNIDIQNIDILDIYCDMFIENVQDSEFLFISAAVENDVLKKIYPDCKELFVGDADIETLTQTHKLSNRSIILDCYYKKADGTLHLIKFCRGNIISATEDMDGYENGLYDHGLYPVVFDVLYPVEHCPFGFGMIDVGKSTQIQIDKIDSAITENLVKTAKTRYFSKKNGGIEETEFKDMSRDIVHYEGDGNSIQSISGVRIDGNYITYRETKKDELKELVANRDFQQGESSNGVVSGTAISLLQQSGEKRARSMIDDSYEAYRQVISMVIEIIRQFYKKPITLRSSDEFGNKTFLEFSNELLMKSEYDMYSGFTWTPLCFDIDIIPQKENPFTREAQNSMLLQLWSSGMFNPQTLQLSMTILRSMNFDGKEKLLSDLQDFMNESQNKAKENVRKDVSVPTSEDELVPISVAENETMAQDELVPIDLNSLSSAVNGVI